MVKNTRQDITTRRSCPMSKYIKSKSKNWSWSLVIHYLMSGGKKVPSLRERLEKVRPPRGHWSHTHYPLMHTKSEYSRIFMCTLIFGRIYQINNARILNAKAYMHNTFIPCFSSSQSWLLSHFYSSSPDGSSRWVIK